MTYLSEKAIRYSLGILLLLVAVNAFAGGYYAMSGAENVPAAWLKHSPFENYFIPGVILFVCIGGSALVAAIAVFRQHRLARNTSFICGIIILVWLSVQVFIIGYVSWMQPATAIAAMIILILAWRLSLWPKSK